MQERGNRKDERRQNDDTRGVAETASQDSATTRRAVLTGGAVAAGAAVATVVASENAAASSFVVLGGSNVETTATVFRSSADRAVSGLVTSGNAIALSGRAEGAHGSGVLGIAVGDYDSYGVWGISHNGSGVRGESRRGAAISGRGGDRGVNAEGENYGGAFGATGSRGIGVYGAGRVYGVFGNGTTLGIGVYGQGRYGVYGAGDYRVFGTCGAITGGYGVFGEAPDGSYAVYANGHAHVTGTLSKAAGSFQIDHPLDPDHKWLRHSFVESPDMMNVYNGNVTTDSTGLATVDLPAYFTALNRDFRYQLTVIGTMALVIVDREIAGNQFRIRTDKGNVKVSWQVTGIRQDDYAKAHPIVVEEKKKAAEASARQFVPQGSTAHVRRHAPETMAAHA